MLYQKLIRGGSNLEVINLKHKVIKLDGVWNLSYNDIGMSSYDEAILKVRNGESIPCPVPGDVHMALMDAGVIKDPLVDLNSKECTWISEKEFWYEKSFEVTKDTIKDRTTITFEGLDLSADIWLNGHYLGQHDNAFIEVDYDITDTLQEGMNTIFVRIDEGLNKVKNKDLEQMGMCWNNDQPYRAWMRKPQFVYGWDWTIWLPTCGIWKSVVIQSYDHAYLNDVYVHTEFGSEKVQEGQAVDLVIDTQIEVLKGETYTISCEVFLDNRYDYANETIASCSQHITAGDLSTLVASFNMQIEDAQLWWPNQTGRPYLYHVVVSLLDKDGVLLHKMDRKHGIRTISIREEELGHDEKGFTFMVNGEPIFAKGSNHVPSDCLIGRVTDEKSRRIVKEAADCNMNMIRVWGGGVYESEAFMAACDESGLMVWHDFMFACGYHPDHDPEFYNNVRIEATAAIKRLRNHTSLIGWSGNNEVQEMYFSAKLHHPDLPWYGGKIYEELLPELVAVYNYNVIYRESSPYGGKGLPSDFEEGDQHVWHFTHRPNYEHYMDLWRFTDMNLKFLSEFGVIGAMNMEAAQKSISEEALYPDSPEWLHHSNTSADHKLLGMTVETYFGDYSQLNAQEFILKSQVIQAEIIRHIYDEFRSRKFICSGLLFWTLGDSYGIHNWAILDYYLGKRPVYYYLKRSMAPLAIAIKGYDVQNFEGTQHYLTYFKENPEPLSLYVMNDLLQDKMIHLEYQLITFNAEVLKQGHLDKTVGANSVDEYMQVDISSIRELLIPEEAVLHVQISCDGEVVNENKYLFAPFSKLKLATAKVMCSVNEISSGEQEIVLEASDFVWMLHLATPDGITYSDNDFDLLPNRKKVIYVEGDHLENYVPELLSLNPGLEITMK